MEIEIVLMNIENYDEVMELWLKEEGLSIKLADTRENIKKYLERNPGLSFIAKYDNKIIGAVLCGHDGRRGYLNHMVVSDDFRRKGIGTKLFFKCTEALKGIGIFKCHLFVKNTNLPAIKFWKKLGLEERKDISMFSIISVDNAEA